MNCEGITTPFQSHGPRSWELSARSISGLCGMLLDAGFPPTLFLAPDCAEEQAPMLEELAARGVELGLFVSPPSLSEGRLKGRLGTYGADQQRALVELAARRVEDAVSLQPRSVRSAGYSASNETFRVLYELGFRQGSLSSPGQSLPKEGAVWVGAPLDAHHVDAGDRLRAGALPFLELPVTSDPEQVSRSGYPIDLRIENGPFEQWHRPIIERQLARMQAEGVPFRALCVATGNSMPYGRPAESYMIANAAPLTSKGRRPLRGGPAPTPYTATLEDLLDYFEQLEQQYEIVPVTLAGAHERYRRVALS
jgi:hypothetical protein